MKFMLLNVKMTTNFGILTLISIIKTKSLNARNIAIFQLFDLYGKGNFLCSLVEHETYYITLGSGSSQQTPLVATSKQC